MIAASSCSRRNDHWSVTIANADMELQVPVQTAGNRGVSTAPILHGTTISSVLRAAGTGRFALSTR
jgi:hypothetical protein